MSTDIKPGQQGRAVRDVTSSGGTKIPQSAVVTVTYHSGGPTFTATMENRINLELRVKDFLFVPVYDADTTPAPLDPSKVKAGDTVTVIVQPDEDRPESTTTGEVWADYRDNPHGPILRVGTVHLGGPMVTLTAHQPAPEPEPEWEPGTSGTATLNNRVSGNAALGMRAMRVLKDGAWSFVFENGAWIRDDATTWSVSDFVPDEPRPTVSTEELSAVAHDVLAGYEASHAAMHVAEAITVYLSGHGWKPDTGPTAVEHLATMLAGKFGGHSDAYLDVASEVVAFQRGESR